MSIEPVILNPVLRRTAQAASTQAPIRLAEASLPQLARAEGQAAEQGLSKSMGIGRAALAVVAGLVLFFVMGPRALKFAAKGAGVLAKALVSPKAMTNLVHKGMMLFGMLEAALPIARSLGLGNLRMPTQLAALAQQAGRVAPMATMTPGSIAAPAMLAPAIADALPRAGQFASDVIRQAPPGIKQQAQVLINGLSKVVNQLKTAAAPTLQQPLNPLQGIRPV